MAAHCLDPDMEIYTRDLGDKLELSLVEKNEQQRIWETIVRPGRLRQRSRQREGDFYKKLPPSTYLWLLDPTHVHRIRQDMCAQPPLTAGGDVS